MTGYNEKATENLKQAMAERSGKKIRAALKAKADPNTPMEDGKTLLHLYCRIKPSSPEDNAKTNTAITYLVSAGGNPDLPDNDGNTARRYAAANDELNGTTYVQSINDGLQAQLSEKDHFLGELGITPESFVSRRDEQSSYLSL